MVNMVLVSVALMMLEEAWKWGKSFHLDELPEFSVLSDGQTRNHAGVMRIFAKLSDLAFAHLLMGLSATHSLTSA